MIKFSILDESMAMLTLTGPGERVHFQVVDAQFVGFLKKMREGITGLVEESDRELLDIPVSTWPTDRGFVEIRLERPESFRFGPEILVLRTMTE